MPKSPLRIFKSVKEFVDIKDQPSLPSKVRGIYVLYDKAPKEKYKVVYIGRSESNVRERIHSHTHSKRKIGQWDHFSIFEVHDNISNEEIKELESLILFIYRKDPRTNKLNALRSSKKFRSVRKVPLGATITQPGRS
jgi:bisphosphoglycerate-independent phosphoglycerate mutase (AlkP superfamily)